MKKVFLFLLMMAFFKVSNAQNGIVTYKEVIKFDFGEEMSEEMKKMLPPGQEVIRELVFNESESLYRVKKGDEPEEVDVSSEDGSMRIKIKTSESEGAMYKNYDEGLMLDQTDLMGRTFIISADLEKFKWKLTNEKVEYLGYECHKAELTTEDEHIVAWFTPQIPISYGPGEFDGLPGLILMVNIDDGSREIKAMAVDLDQRMEIKRPKKGKKVTLEEFDQIREKKEKEMMEQAGRGGRVIKIER